MKRTKLPSKVIMILIASMFLVSFIAISTPALATQSKILVLAKGEDLDIPGAKTLIEGKIEFDKMNGQFYFKTKIYDNLGRKIYTIEGSLKNGAIMAVPQYYCDVRKVLWVNLWLVMGEGMIKTSDEEMTLEYRGQTILLPNTKGKYVSQNIVMLVSPHGEIEIPNDENINLGGWAYAGILGYFGGVTSLVNYVEISI